jgi:hypothetical protein
MLPTVVMCPPFHPDDAADLDDCLALGDQLHGGLELADDL